MSDILYKGMLFNNSVHFFAIDGTQMVSKAHQIHQTSATCIAALGRTLMGTALLGSMEKNDRDKITVRISGGGPAGNILCVGNRNAQVKGYLVHAQVELPEKRPGKLDVSGAVGSDGTITVIRDLGMKEPYTGQTEMISGEIAEDFAAYLLNSCQQPSIVYLGVHVNKDFSIAAAGGMMIQPLPFCPPEVVSKLEELAPRISAFAQRLQDEDSCEIALKKLFFDCDLQLTESLQPEYECDCSRERTEKALISLGKTELTKLIDEDGKAELNCYFCDQKYLFDKQNLIDLLEEARQ